LMAHIVSVRKNARPILGGASSRVSASERPLCTSKLQQYPHGASLAVNAPTAHKILCPVYVLGEAYLAARRGKEAAAEFQKILDHRDMVLNEPIGALAHLQLARAYSIEGETAKSRRADQDFLTLWKDADPDIPIFKQANAEYAKLPVRFFLQTVHSGKNSPQSLDMEFLDFCLPR
jgi:hypothetical protein